MRIMFYNLAYCSGVNGSFSRYIRYGHRMWLPHGGCVRTMEGMMDLMSSEQPDVCCFVELSLESRLLHHVRQLFPHVAASNKYGDHTRYGTLPHLRSRIHAVASRFPLDVRNHFLSAGLQRLVQEVRLPNALTLFSAHLSPKTTTRTKQIKELSPLLHQTNGNTLCCADFNTFGGSQELHPILQSGKFQVASPLRAETFPTSNPKYGLDYLLHSSSVACGVQTIDAPWSDHLPLIIDV